MLEKFLVLCDWMILYDENYMKLMSCISYNVWDVVWWHIKYERSMF